MDKNTEAAEQAALMAELDDVPGELGGEQEGDQAGEQAQETPPAPAATAPEEPAAPPAQTPGKEPPQEPQAAPAGQEPPAQAEPEPAPTAQEPPAPVDEMEALRKQNAQLIAMVNTLAGGKAPAPVSTPPAPSQAQGAQPVQAPAQPQPQAPAPEELAYQPQQFFTAEELDSLALDPAVNDGLNRVGTYIWDLVNKTNQRLLAQAGQQAEAVVQYNAFMQDFFTANPDLREVRNVVTSNLETMAAEHAASGQALDHDGALVSLSQRVRTSLGLPATVAPVTPAPAQTPAQVSTAKGKQATPALPGYSGGRGGRGGGGKSGGKTQKDYMSDLD